MNRELAGRIEKICEELFATSVKAEIFRPDEQFGDFSTNAALKLAGKAGKTPREIAQSIAGALEKTGGFSEVSVAGPGFVNMTLEDPKVFAASLESYKLKKPLAGQKVVAEYSDPNPFKVLHAGHLYTSMVGDSISNILEVAGAEVHRVNYGGDVGLHVAKTMWAILKDLAGENPEGLEKIAKDRRADWLADCYVKGTAAYEDEEKVRDEISALNKKYIA